MGDDHSARCEFLSWLMGDNKSEERLEKNFESTGQTICLLNSVDPNVADTYKLDDDSLYLEICGYKGVVAEGVAPSQRLKVTGKGSEWGIDGECITVNEFWTRLGEWQCKQYTKSISRVFDSIVTGQEILESKLQKGLPTRYDDNGIDIVISFLDEYILPDEHISALEDEFLKDLRHLRFFTATAEPAFIMEIKNRIQAARNASVLFLHESVFVKLVEELLIQDTLPSCQKFFEKVGELAQPRLDKYCDEIYGHLRLGAGMKKKIENELECNLEFWTRKVKAIASRFFICDMFDACGRVKMGAIENKRRRQNSDAIDGRSDSRLNEDSESDIDDCADSSSSEDKIADNRAAHVASGEDTIDDIIATEMSLILVHMRNRLSLNFLANLASYDLHERLASSWSDTLSYLVRYTDSFLVTRKENEAEKELFVLALRKVKDLKEFLLTI